MDTKLGRPLLQFVRCWTQKTKTVLLQFVRCWTRQSRGDSAIAVHEVLDTKQSRGDGAVAVHEVLDTEG